MTTSSYLTDLVQHSEWADAAVWRAVLPSPEAGADARLLGWLHHIHQVQELFRQAWSGGSFQLHDRAEFPDLRALAGWGREAHGRIHAFLAAAGPEEIERELRLPWAARLEQAGNRPARPLTVGDSVVQVALHTAHHRGQACARLRELGGAPPLLDFIVWLWQGRPKADWSFLGESEPKPGS